MRPLSRHIYNNKICHTQSLVAILSLPVFMSFIKLMITKILIQLVEKTNNNKFRWQQNRQLPIPTVSSFIQYANTL